MILFTVALIGPQLQQQSIAQEQQQPPYNRTTFDTKNSIEDLSFSIDDVLNLSHYKTVVNGIELHYVIAGEEKGYPIVLLHGWPPQNLQETYSTQILSCQSCSNKQNLRLFIDCIYVGI
jgi:hypothetical protein